MQFSVRCFLLLLAPLILLHPYNSNADKRTRSPKHRVIHLTPDNKNIDATISSTKREYAGMGTLIYSWYNGTAITRSQGGYSGYLLDGPYTESTYPGNNLVSKGHYKKGLKNGEWATWHENGRLKKTEEWKNGILHGNSCGYDIKGTLLKCDFYKNGVLYIPENDTNTHRQYVMKSAFNKALSNLQFKKDSTAKKK